MKKPPAPPRATKGAPLGEAALGVEVPELEEELEESEEPEELDPEEVEPEEDGVLAPLFTSNLTPVISLPV